MQRKVLQLLATVLVACPLVGFAQTHKDGIYFTAEDIQAVLKHAADTKRTIPDNTIRVLDMGKYNLGVAVVHRGAMKARGAGPGGGSPAAPSNPQPACGEQSAGATGPGGLYHDDTAESYIITSGSATMITGGRIVNGRRSAPDSEVTKILNGPSCGGTIVGGTSHDVKVGDIVIIPEGVPHGFIAIPDHVTYLSIRPDLKKVLQQGYVNPGLKKQLGLTPSPGPPVPR